MEYKTKYGLGDVLSIMDYYDVVFTGIVKKIEICDFNGNAEIYYNVKVGQENINVPEKTYNNHDGEGESMYTICGKVGNIGTLIG